MTSAVDEKRWLRAINDCSGVDDAWTSLGVRDLPPSKNFEGYCQVCREKVRFESEGDFPGDINWRESVRCPSCGLINRWRAAFSLFSHLANPTPREDIYLTEALTPLATSFRAKWPDVFLSEYLDSHLKSGEISEVDGVGLIRHEDVTALSFKDESLDHILTFDVLEHVPNYKAALFEFSRCLTDGGTLLISAPFLPKSEESLRRASVNKKGDVTHHLPPEYHGDPLQENGILCFWHFGWDLLDDLNQAGFQDTRVYIVSSIEYGYVGPQLFIYGRRIRS